MRERKNGFTLYLSDEELHQFNKQSKLAGINRSAFLRKCIMNTNLQPRPPDEFTRLAREINAVGNNINQIAHRANAEQHITVDMIKEVLSNQDELIRIMRGVR